MDRQDVLGIRRRLLKGAIKKRTKEHHRLVLERDRLEKRTSETLSSIDRYILHKSIDQNLKNGEKEFIKTQEKKLKNLTKNSILKRSIQLSDLLLIRSSPARPESSRYHRTEKLLVTSTLRWLNTVLAVFEYRSFAKLWQEKGCSSQAETWQVKNIMMKDFD